MEKKQLLIQLGRNIKSERAKKGLSQEQLAEVLGKSAHYISQVECGYQNMSLAKINEFAIALNIDINKLLDF